jgi:hypothetical protein
MNGLSMKKVPCVVVLRLCQWLIVQGKCQYRGYGKDTDIEQEGQLFPGGKPSRLSANESGLLHRLDLGSSPLRQPIFEFGTLSTGEE